MPTPVTYASAKQFIGVAKEAVQGTPVAMTTTIPLEKFDWEDKPVFLDDKAMRGSMVESYGRQAGVIKTSFSMSGPVFMDTLPFLLANLLGDAAYTGGTLAGGALGPTTAILTAGVSSVIALTSVTGLVPGSVITIDTAGLLELATVLSIASLNVTLTAPVQFSHASGITVSAVTAPFTTALSTLNSGNGQPISHTITHNFQIPSGTGTRQLAGACISDVNITWNAETSLLTFTAKGDAWATNISGTTPVPAPSAAQPVASWRGVMGIGGPASGGTKVLNVQDGAIDIKRVLEVVYTTQNAQVPYIIQRGAVSATGKLVFIADSETPYLNMLTNLQPQMQLLLDNAAAGAASASVQIDVQNMAYDGVKLNFGKAAIAYDTTFYAVANTVNAGLSGGYSPVKVTFRNAVAPRSYL